MPTKRELLEEKTVKELKQMARDEDLSGYSSMRKSGLIDMVRENYTKAEIQSWSEELKESAPPKRTEREIEELKKRFEEGSAESGVGEPEEESGEPPGEVAERRKGINTRTIIGVIAALIIVGIIIVLLIP